MRFHLRLATNFHQSKLSYVHSAVGQQFSVEDMGAQPRKVSFFTWRGAPENWGDQVLFLDQKRDQKIFQIKKGGVPYIY